MNLTRNLRRALSGTGDVLRRVPRRTSRPGLGLLAVGALAATAAYVAYRARVAEREHPPLGRFIEVDGVTLHYLERGQGPAVVLLHGNGAMASDFDGSGLIDALARSHRVIAFDRPGFGYSKRPRRHIWNAPAQAALLSHALAQLDVHQPVIVAHSWATLVALSLARDFPETLRGLVLISGYYFPTWRADTFLLSPPAIPLLGDIMRYTISPIIGRLIARPLIRQMFAPRPVSKRFRAAVPLALMLRPSQLRAAAEESGLMIWGAAQLKKSYSTLRLPVIILAGDGDRVIDLQRQAVRLHRDIPGSELRSQPGMGHMLHYDVPGAVTQAVSDVVTRTGADATPVKGLAVV